MGTPHYISCVGAPPLLRSCSSLASFLLLSCTLGGLVIPRRPPLLRRRPAPSPGACCACCAARTWPAPVPAPCPGRLGSSNKQLSPFASPLLPRLAPQARDVAPPALLLLCRRLGAGLHPARDVLPQAALPVPDGPRDSAQGAPAPLSGPLSASLVATLLHRAPQGAAACGVRGGWELSAVGNLRRVPTLHRPHAPAACCAALRLLCSFAPPGALRPAGRDPAEILCGSLGCHPPDADSRPGRAPHH